MSIKYIFREKTAKSTLCETLKCQLDQGKFALRHKGQVKDANIFILLYVRRDLYNFEGVKRETGRFQYLFEINCFVVIVQVNLLGILIFREFTPRPSFVDNSGCQRSQTSSLP